MPTKAGAKRPVHLAKFAARKRAKTRRKNPDGFIENVKDGFASSGLVHAVGGYASARLAGRIARRLVAAKFPGFARHSTPLANLAAAIAIYFITKKWRKIREEAMIGAVIAFVQSVLQTYMPGLAATFLDTDAGLELATAKTAAQVAQGLAGHDQAAMPSRRKQFVLPGEIEVERAEARAAAPSGPVKFVIPGSPGSGYGAPATSDFDDATADIPTGAADDLGDDGDLGIFSQ